MLFLTIWLVGSVLFGALWALVGLLLTAHGRQRQGHGRKPEGGRPPDLARSARAGVRESLDVLIGEHS